MNRESEIVKPVTERLKWARDQKTAIVEIDCRVMAMVVPESGCIAPQGVHRFQVPQSALPLITGPHYQRTDDDRKFYQLAKETYERELQFRIDDDYAVRKFRERGEADEERARIKELTQTHGGSPEAVLQRDFRRELPPFERVTVIEDDLPNPADVVRLAEENDRLAQEKALRTEETAAAAAAVASAVAAALAPLVNAIGQSQTGKKGG